MEYSSAKAHFRRFCETMDSYSGLLSFIPDEDKYAKPFCGVLTTIVQVITHLLFYFHTIGSSKAINHP